MRLLDLRCELYRSAVGEKIQTQYHNHHCIQSGNFLSLGNFIALKSKWIIYLIYRQFCNKKIVAVALWQTETNLHAYIVLIQLAE
jgi:hypothetical protein